jgi:very-long-chain (3R)-3-hydroxyacyl-CoA dehydratase
MSNTVKYYLAAYNFIAFVFWFFFLVSFIGNGLVLNGNNQLLLNIAQGMAVLEILHVVLKWVKSPIGSTIAQVASRLLVVGLINFHVNSVLEDRSWQFYQSEMSQLTQLGIAIVSFAWSITELIRYSFYFLSLFKIEWRPLLWMRYTFFIVLYPLGVTGEWFIIVHPLVKKGFTFTPYAAFALVLFLVYAYYFPKLYGYMWKQRKAKL